MPVLRDIGLLATCPPDGAPGDVGPVEGAALAWRGDRVAWLGPEEEMPSAWQDEPARSAAGALVVPGLVDAHTHLAFGGWRDGEFERRLLGESYADIAAAGGGIAATVRATRAAAEDELADRAGGFLQAMARLGVTTVEAKSGYGLTLEEERKQLRVYRRLDEEGPLRLVPTFLAAHALPPEFADDRGGFLDRVVEAWIPAVAEEGLARFCDAFLEEGAFTADEVRRVLEAGREHGLRPKLHADQLSDGGGAALAAELGAASADHLEHVSAAGVSAMADAGTVAVLLPLAGLYLDQPPAPARTLVEAGVPVAVATDFNPGTAPSYHLPLAMTLACVREGLTPSEALRGATVHAARALDLGDEVGSLAPGRAADFAVIDAPDPRHWLYHHRPNACLATVAAGRPVWSAPEGPFPEVA